MVCNRILLLLSILVLHGCYVDSSITVSRDGKGDGTITGGKIDCGSKCEASYSTNYLYGGVFGIATTVPLTATPAEGSEFYGWHSYWMECEPEQTECNIKLHLDLLDPYGDALDPDNYNGDNRRITAIFVPAGDVVESAWQGFNSCYISTDGSIPCWRYSEAPLLNQPNNLQLTRSYACALDQQMLHCWAGANTYNRPPLIPNNLLVTKYNAQNSFLCALQPNHILECYGTQENSPRLALQVPELDTPTDIWSDSDNVCAETAAGIQCWGEHFQGQSKPPALNSPISISGTASRTCAVFRDTGVACWGDDRTGADFVSAVTEPAEVAVYGRLRAGLCIKDSSNWHCSSSQNDELPLPLPIQSATTLKTNDQNICGSGLDGFACVWNNSGSQRVLPDTMASPVDFSVASNHICTLNDRTVQCLGILNGYIGEHFTAPRNVDLQQPQLIANNYHNLCVAGIDGVICYGEGSTLTAPADLRAVTAISINRQSACVIASGEVRCWGSNEHGLLNVPTLTNPSAITLGDYHACAIDGAEMVCWGETLTER